MKIDKSLYFLTIFLLIIFLTACSDNSQSLSRNDNTMLASEDTNPQFIEKDSTQIGDNEQNNNTKDQSKAVATPYQPVNQYDLVDYIGEPMPKDLFENLGLLLDYDSSKDKNDERIYEDNSIRITVSKSSQLIKLIQITTYPSEYNLCGITVGMPFNEAKAIINNNCTNIINDTSVSIGDLKSSYDGSNYKYYLKISKKANEDTVDYVEIGENVLK